MPDYEPLIAQIFHKSGIEFRAASPLDISKLQALGLPQVILDFYRSYEPSRCIECQVRLWPIKDILEENESLVPGCYASKHGYFVFATTVCGDTYCFDLSRGTQAESRIVLLSHEVVSEETTSEEFARLAKPVAQSFHEFLEQFVRGEVDEECVYE
jgi:SMI1 / KNR4 family (SUKH-1)